MLLAKRFCKNINLFREIILEANKQLAFAADEKSCKIQSNEKNGNIDHGRI